MSDPVVRAEALIKRYGELEAVAGIDFEVGAGECFGFLGVNGAGKTTTVRMVQCVSPPSGGTLEVLGSDVTEAPRRIKARLGVVPQEDNLDPDLDVVGNLRVYSRYFDLPRRQAREQIAELLEFVQLSERAASPVATLSGGMRRRLVLAQAMLSSPELLLLDEPTSGLDPQARHWVWARLRRLCSAGVTMLLTTHYMEEAAQLCDRVAVIDAGKLLAVGAPERLVLDTVGERCIELRPKPDQQQKILAVRAAIDAPSVQIGDTIYIHPRQQIDLAALAAIPHERLVERPATLEDLFLRLTGRELPR